MSCLKAQIGDAARWQSDLPPLDGQGEVELEPETVMDRRMVRQGNKVATKILVKWRGLGREEATWELYHKICAKYPSFLYEDDVEFGSKGM